MKELECMQDELFVKVTDTLNQIFYLKMWWSDNDAVSPDAYGVIGMEVFTEALLESDGGELDIFDCKELSENITECIDLMGINYIDYEVITDSKMINAIDDAYYKISA